MCCRQLPAIRAVGPAASLHPPSANAAVVQAIPGRHAFPAGECTPCHVLLGGALAQGIDTAPQAAASWALNQTSSFILCTAKKSICLRDPWFLPFQLLSFYQGLERNWGKKSWLAKFCQKFELGLEKKELNRKMPIDYWDCKIDYHLFSFSVVVEEEVKGFAGPRNL